jgi:predicted ATP-dependent serine protease
LNLLVGDPGLGKSTIGLDIAARISQGAAWPDTGSAPLGDIVVLTAEDGLADTVRPRLDLHGADARRVHVLRAVRDATGIERSVSLATDLGPLEQAIIKTQAVLVVIDPISAYLGAANSYRDSEVRSILAPLHALAERTGAAILGVMHLTKDQQRQALYRGQGSIAFVGAARLVLAVGADPDDESRERRFVMPVKSNVCAPAATLAYRIVSVGGRGRLA